MDKEISCHDCSSIVKIIDEFGEYELDDIKHCPICGSENIVVE